MRQVLVVSPRFAPSNGADTHRVRTSLRYFERYGWRPSVLAVSPEFVESEQDHLLAEAVRDIEVTKVPALPTRLTRKCGLGDLAIRSFPYLYSAGRRLLRDRRFDLVYFSTTAFSSLALGRLWKQSHAVPYVVDMQDPWLSDYYTDKPRAKRPPKYWFSLALSRRLEPWTMQSVDGLIATSPSYLETLSRRYPWLVQKPQLVLPFGAESGDFDVLRRNRQPNPFFVPGDGSIHAVYVGRAGHDMAPSLRLLFRALKRGVEKEEAFRRLRLHFVGTDYAPGDSGKKTVTPIAVEESVSEQVSEYPRRVPYFQALQLLLDADLLVVPGSDDPQYTASKMFPYLLSRKPMLAVFNRRSLVCQLLQETKTGELVSFESGDETEPLVAQTLAAWERLLGRVPCEPQAESAALVRYSAAELTRQQCRLFDQVVAASQTE